MTKEQIMVELFEFSAPTYYKWTKKEKRKIFDLLNYAFSLEELEEFIRTGKIKKIETLNNNDNKEKFEELEIFTSQLTKVSNPFIAKNIINIMTEHFINHNNKIDIEDLIYEIFSSDYYYFIECADEEFFSEFDESNYNSMRWNEFTSSLDADEQVTQKILLMRKYKIITLIQTTSQEFLYAIFSRLSTVH